MFFVRNKSIIKNGISKSISLIKMSWLITSHPYQLNVRYSLLIYDISATRSSFALTLYTTIGVTKKYLPDIIMFAMTVIVFY